MDGTVPTLATPKQPQFWGDEWVILPVMTTTVLFKIYGADWMHYLGEPLWFGVILGVLFGVILAAAFRVVHHAESLAVILGEPAGTLILSLAAITIEIVMIASVMLTGDNKPALARDTIFAALMIVLNGMVGLSLLLGGLRHTEQTYNFYGSNAFLGLIAPLSILGLVLPNFTATTAAGTFSPFQAIFLGVMGVGVYVIFVLAQTSRYQQYFRDPQASPELAEALGHEEMATYAPWYHTLLLAGYLLPVVLLAKQLAYPIDYGIEVIGAPQALGGLLVAVVILAAESLSAVRAALDNKMQRAINVLMGSALCTTSLVIPTVLTVGAVASKPVVLGLEPVEMVLLLLTLLVSTLTFAGNRTNYIQGLIHFLLFTGFLVLIFEN